MGLSVWDSGAIAIMTFKERISIDQVIEANTTITLVPVQTAPRLKITLM